MGWTNWPGGVSVTSTGTGSAGASYSVTYNTAEQWSWWVQAWLAMRERHAVTNNGCSLLWPPGDEWFPQSQGTVESIVDNHDGTMTVSMTGYFYWTGGSSCSSPRWVGYTCPNACGGTQANIPADYDLIITTDDTNSDPFQVYRGQITAETYTAGNDFPSSSSADDTPSSGTLTITSNLILDAITAKYLASLSTLVGATWYIVKRDTPWTSERLPDKPDPRQLWLGTSSSGGTITIGMTTYSYLQDTTPGTAWPNFFSPTAREVLVYGDDGLLHRETIIGNTGNQLWFTHRSYTASGAYKIVVAGTVGKPGRVILPYLQYYTGFSTGYKSHLTDGINDSIGSWPIAGGQVTIQSGDPCSTCDDGEGVETLDGDLFYPTDDACDGQNAGTFVSKNYWKSLHAIQKDIEGLCTSFLPYMDYTGKTYNEIVNWQTATFFNDNSINSWTCSYSYIATGSDTGDLTVSGAPTGDATPSYPIPCYYAIIYDDGNVSGGQATLASPTLLTGATFPEPTISASSESSGCPDTRPQPVTLVLSLAWSRRRERQFLYMFNKTGFIPSQDMGAAVDPPVCEGAAEFPSSSSAGEMITPLVGAWQKRLKSTCYKTRNANGEAVDGSIAFIDTEMARYVGDNANGPGISPFTQDGSGNPLYPYYDLFYRGTYGSYIEKQKQAGKTGNITGKLTGSFTSQQITDATKNWWKDGVNGTIVTTDSGTLVTITPPVGMTPGSATTTITAPANTSSCSFVVTNLGATILVGTSAVTGGASVTLTGAFTSGMAGYDVELTYQGFLHKETGTATSGSTTSITDSSHDTTCWFQNSRFEGFSDPSAYTEFVIEINHANGDGSHTLYKLPVTSTTSTSGVTINFTSVGVTFGAGDTYTIYEPAYEINRWQDRPLQIKDGNTGNVYHTTITFNDYNTLYFGQVYNSSNSPITITPATDGTWQYTITNPTYGGVWKWNAATSLWVEVTGGNDTTRLGVTSPQPFKSDSRCNLPTIYKDYGALQPDDITTSLLFSEIYTCINSMQATRNSPEGWYKNAVPGTPEVYEGNVLNDGASNFFGTFDDEPCYGGNDPRYPCPATVPCPSTASDNEDVVEFLLQPGACLWSCPACIDMTGWQTLDPGDGPGSAPFVINEYSSAFQFYGDGSLGGGLQGCTQVAVSAYLKINNICTLKSATCDFYNFGTGSGSCAGDCSDKDGVYGPNEGNFGTTCQPCINSFDNYGQPVNYRTWTKWSSADIDDTGSAVSSKLGEVSEPFTPSPVEPRYDGSASAVVFDPPMYEYDGSSNDGYKVSDQTCILKWSFDYHG